MTLYFYLSIYAFVFAPMVLPPVLQLVETIVRRVRVLVSPTAQRQPTLAV